jgi:hypothetical protein
MFCWDRLLGRYYVLGDKLFILQQSSWSSLFGGYVLVFIEWNSRSSLWSSSRTGSIKWGNAACGFHFDKRVCYKSSITTLKFITQWFETHLMDWESMVKEDSRGRHWTSLGASSGMTVIMSVLIIDEAISQNMSATRSSPIGKNTH